MRILLTNDDGLRAPGIEALHEQIVQLGQVLPIAPLEVQSAASHSVTFGVPLMTFEIDISKTMHGIAVDGRPADCVKLAIENIWPQRFGAGQRPDLVISGMNMGCNVGIHIIYSGTVGAAIEAAFLGIPAIAVSLHFANELGPGAVSRIRWDVAARHARQTIQKCLAQGPIEPHTVLNINIPVTESDRPLPPIKVVPMNLSGLHDRYEQRTSPNGQVYYWPVGDGMLFHHTTGGSDVEELLAGNITVTPLQYDLAHHAQIDHWRKRLT